MSDDQQKQPNAAGKESADLLAALREMGQQIEVTFRTTMESERVRQLQRDLASGVRELTSQVEKTVERVQADPRVQQAEERGRQVLQQAQESKVVQDVQDALVKGIGQITDQLRKLVERMDSERAAKPPAGAATSQQVPIDQEPPATSETTRLDQ